MMFLRKLNWPSVVLLVAVICAVVVAAALGVSREVLALISGAGALLTALAPALGSRQKYDDNGNSLPPPSALVALLFLGLGPLLMSGCGGTASRVSTAASCSSLMLTIGERADYAPERAVADIDSVAAVCRRLDVDAGAP